VKKSPKSRLRRPTGNGRDAGDGLLSRTRGFADGVAALFFPYAEVVVHDLSNQSIAHIANNLSRREVGDDSALENAEFRADELVIGPYEKRNWDGTVMRAVSIVVRDRAGFPTGVVCINLNISVFDQARAALDLLVSGARLTPQPQVIFQDDWQERINTFVHGWLSDHQVGLTALTRLQKRVLVEDLYRNGAFKGRSAAEYIARVLKMGRATVFKHVKELRDRSVGGRWAGQVSGRAPLPSKG
jgi:predicted transcriptional regulator YheO